MNRVYWYIRQNASQMPSMISIVITATRLLLMACVVGAGVLSGGERADFDTLFALSANQESRPESERRNQIDKTGFDAFPGAVHRQAITLAMLLSYIPDRPHPAGHAQPVQR